MPVAATNSAGHATWQIFEITGLPFRRPVSKEAWQSATILSCGADPQIG